MNKTSYLDFPNSHWFLRYNIFKGTQWPEFLKRFCAFFQFAASWLKIETCYIKLKNCTHQYGHFGVYNLKIRSGVLELLQKTCFSCLKMPFYSITQNWSTISKTIIYSRIFYLLLRTFWRWKIENPSRRSQVIAKTRFHICKKHVFLNNMKTLYIKKFFYSYWHILLVITNILALKFWKSIKAF